MTAAKPFEVMAWASTTLCGSASKKLILITLASYADENWQCWPGQQTLAEVTELGERTIRRLLAEMEADGLIRRDERRRSDGYRTSDLFTLRPPATVAAEPPISPAIDDNLTGHLMQTSPATMAGQELPVELPVELPALPTSRGQLALVGNPAPAALPDQAHHQAVGQVLGSDRDLAFVEFWRVFPLKVGKGQARKAWATARRRGVLPEVMVAGAHSYAKDPNRDPGYTKHPATWLNGECWDDEPLPTRDMPRSGAARTADAFARYRRPSTTALASALQAALPAGGEP